MRYIVGASFSNRKYVHTISCVEMGTLSVSLSAHLQPLLHAWTSYLFNKHKGRAIRFAKKHQNAEGVEMRWRTGQKFSSQNYEVA